MWGTSLPLYLIDKFIYPTHNFIYSDTAIFHWYQKPSLFSTAWIAKTFQESCKTSGPYGTAEVPIFVRVTSQTLQCEDNHYQSKKYHTTQGNLTNHFIMYINSVDFVPPENPSNRCDVNGFWLLIVILNKINLFISFEIL